MPLVLTRKTDERVIIWKDGGSADDSIEVIVGEIKGSSVQLLFKAKRHIMIARKELLCKKWRDTHESK